MRTDGRRNDGRPRGAVLRPLVLLIAAVMTGFGMWHALTRDDHPSAPAASHLSRQERTALENLLRHIH